MAADFKERGRAVRTYERWIPEVGSRVWTTTVSTVGTGFHVRPSRGLTSVGNWALNPHHRRGFGNFCAQFWRMWSGAYIRREYPKSEKGLRKAVAECDIWCERESAAESVADDVMARLSGSSEANRG